MSQRHIITVHVTETHYFRVIAEKMHGIHNIDMEQRLGESGENRTCVSEGMLRGCMKWFNEPEQDYMDGDEWWVTAVNYQYLLNSVNNSTNCHYQSTECDFLCMV